MIRIVLVRHGQSTWNQENRFTGWVDVELSRQGVDEAREAGRMLRNAGHRFDIALTSMLQRSIRTARLILEELDQTDVPVNSDWRLNERHYGALQGRYKHEVMPDSGAQRMHRRRLGYAVRPPALDRNDPTHPRHDPRYAGVPVPPNGESLADTLARVVSCYDQECVPLLRSGRSALVIAHGDVIRALIKHLDGISEEASVNLYIPTGAPLVYVLDASLRPLDRYYLGDRESRDTRVREIGARARIG